MTKIICGVDVSKARLDACVAPGGEEGRFPNDPAGRAALAAFCAGHGVELVVLEATGGLEQDVADAVRKAGLPVAIVNPRQVRRFAEAMGAFEKTDRIDAKMIARYALARALAPTPAQDPGQRRLKTLMGRLRQVVGDLVVNKQRRSAARDAETRESLDEVIAVLKRQSRRLEGEIASLIDDDPLSRRLDQACREVKLQGGRRVAPCKKTLRSPSPWQGGQTALNSSKLSTPPPIRRFNRRVAARTLSPESRFG